MDHNNKELRNQLLHISNDIVFMKEVIIDMSNNLINLHKLKIFEGLNHGYTDIFNELTNVKNQLKKYPDYLKPTYLTTNNKTLEYIKTDLDCIRKEIIKYSNHIVPSDIKMVLRLLLGNSWKNINQHDS